MHGLVSRPGGVKDSHPPNTTETGDMHPHQEQLACKEFSSNQTDHQVIVFFILDH